MKLTIVREALLPLLQAISGVIEHRQSVPILNNVLMTATEGVITFTATDIEVEIIVEADQPPDIPGQITLPARKLLDICRSLPEGAMIQISGNGQYGVISSVKSRFKLAALPYREFPNIGEIEPTLTMRLRNSRLKAIITKTQFAMAHHDVRYYLNGLLLEIMGKAMRAVATDGHRLALSEVGLETEVGVKESLPIIVPRKGVTELCRILEGTDSEIDVLVSKNHIQVKLERRTFTSKLIDGRFPDYERVLPRRGEKVVVADTERLRQGILRASVLTNEKYKGIRIMLDKNILRALVQNPEREEAEEEIEVDYAGEPLEIGFNAWYMLDVLAVIKTEAVRLEFTNSTSSCMIQPEGQFNSRYVIMPMRL